MAGAIQTFISDDGERGVGPPDEGGLSVLKNLEDGSQLGEEELFALFTMEDPTPLFETADRVRRRIVGDDVHLRGLIEFSNHCVQNCLYCGLRRGNRALERYRMEPEDIISLAVWASSQGFRTVVLQSGEDPFYTAGMLAWIIEKILKRCEIRITLCIGERSYEEYRSMKEAGAHRFLLKMETSDPALYHLLHPNSSLEERLDAYMSLRDLGFQAGTGNIVGLPGQTDESIVRDIRFFQGLDADMVGIGPFIPHPSTPLGKEPPPDMERVFRTIALTRLLLRGTLIPATTAIATLDPGGREKALRRGANVVMPDITPPPFRQLYDLYPGRRCRDENPDRCLPCLKGIIRGIERNVSEGWGDREKCKD